MELFGAEKGPLPASKAAFFVPTVKAAPDFC